MDNKNKEIYNAQLERDFLDALKSKKKLDQYIIQDGLNIFGSQFLRALDIIKSKERKIELHIFQPSNLRVWVVKGVKSSYIVFQDIYCQCMSFNLSVHRLRENRLCKHMIGVKIGQSLGNYDKFIHEDREWQDFYSGFL